ncbi:guanine-N7--methyltransferase subunit Trm82 [Ephemerocybe angulata]|uniref:Guanine-N7--methyltransferase subunit Trm82 n=1 Tax=Ephemerocybe angulata TaxID=980116 RepID=A0A8H6IC04_9AGAR|nr:guanine-N7--methyltransferase subunit Trm82 [Tulosesus angulatus]
MAAESSSSYPFSRLFVGQEKTVAISGPHIHVLDSSTGETLQSTAQYSTEQLERDSVLKSGPIRCAVVDEAFKYLAEIGEDKMLKLWEISSEEGLKLLNARELPKKPTSIMFTKDSQTVLVSDKFGDVFSYSLVYTPFTTSELEEQKEAKEKDPYASHTNPSNGALILGHVSPLNAMLLTDDEKYIITSDRDEHIRVSWYPQGFNIEMYCLGHHKFVSALHIPSVDSATLISGGGDPALKLWDWMTGQEKAELPVAEVIEPFIVIKRVLGKNRWGAEGEGDENEGESGGKGKKGKGKKGKGKGKGQQAQAKEEDTPEASGAMEVDEAGTPGIANAPSAEDASTSQPAPQKILAIRRIETLTVEKADTFILFSAIGATALFSVPYPSSLSSDAQSLDTSATRHLDFGKPIIDFYIASPPSASSKPLIWVLLDNSWTADDETSASTSDRVRLVTVSSSGELTVIDGEDQVPSASLLKNLNGPAIAVPASAKDLKTLDLYSELLSLPKYVEKLAPGTVPQNVDVAAADAAQPAANLTKRKLGRMKRTTKVEEVKQKVLPGTSQGDDLPEESGEADEPETKRARSSSQTPEDSKP